ncbi:MAG: glutamate-5-semialdehyde dehydrogenase [Halobacteriovoraceae bacterium]|nr:glutamate-5-semialdehyde dehydrogenase [Halobacteriovoraceae bacterium]
MDVKSLALKTELAQKDLSLISEEFRVKALQRVSEALLDKKEKIIEENQKDIEKGKTEGLSDAVIDRLALNEERIKSMAEAVISIAKSPKVLGEIVSEFKRDDGLIIQRERIPIGVIAMIFESRPNVVIDCGALAFKSGNAIILKGGKEANHSNKLLTHIFQEAINDYVNPDVIQLLDSREDLQEILTLKEHIDVVIPRGGEGLIQYVYENSKIPVIAHFKGLCHIYVHDDADLEKATDICMNAKTQRPGVCNAMETLLVHENMAKKFLPKLLTKLDSEGIEIRGCTQTKELFPKAIEATLGDYYTEYLDKILSVKVVPTHERAISHIEEHGTHHTEAILAKDPRVIEAFKKRVDASCIVVNASTRFNDGGELGLGAELGIATTKLHSYGPMGAREITTTRFVVKGEGHIRT